MGIFDIFKGGKSVTCPGCVSHNVEAKGTSRNDAGEVVSKYFCRNCGKEFTKK